MRQVERVALETAWRADQIRIWNGARLPSDPVEPPRDWGLAFKPAFERGWAAARAAYCKDQK